MGLKLNLSRVRVLNMSYFAVLGVSLILLIAAIVTYGLYKNILTLLLVILLFGFVLFSGVVVGVNLTGAYLKVSKVKPIVVEEQKTEPKKEVKIEPKKEEPKIVDVEEANKKFSRKIAKKFKALPKERSKRMQLEREVAKHLQITNGTFTISQLLALLVKVFPKDLSGDRREIADEIKEWVSEDAYTQLVKKDGSISHYELI